MTVAIKIEYGDDSTQTGCQTVSGPVFARMARILIPGVTGGNVFLTVAIQIGGKDVIAVPGRPILSDYMAPPVVQTRFLCSRMERTIGIDPDAGPFVLFVVFACDIGSSVAVQIRHLGIMSPTIG